MKKVLLCLSILLLPIVNYSQNLPKLTPLSPNAASIAKYGEVPIGHFTGAPNIQIPIYTVNSGELNLPILLSYHSGGNKVENIPSWVGLGWSLGTIPSISRKVRGIPDENGGVFSLFSGKTIKEIWDNRNNQLMKENQLMKDYRVHLFKGVRDSEPDIFYYNLPSESGKFFWNQSTKSFITYPKSNIKITRTGNGFTLVTQDGVKYFMDVIETSKTSGKTEGNLTNTTWYASKMISGNKKDIIDFVYRFESQFSKTYHKVTKYHYILGVGNGKPSDNGSILSRNSMNTKVIDKIIFSNGYVDFNESSDYREDLKGGKRLDNISIYNNHNQLVSKYNFVHRYKTMGGRSSGPCNNAESYARKWLLLDKVEQLSNSGTNKLVHSFNYNENHFPSCRRSAGQDYWGYYNGHDENSSLIPTYTVPSYRGTRLTVNGADRGIDPVKSKYGILTKITYPTGGYTEFEFENHQVIDTDVPSQYTSESQMMSGDESFGQDKPSNRIYTETKQFTINNPPNQFLNGNRNNGGANVYFSFKHPGCDLSGGNSRNCARFMVRGTSPSKFTYDITFPGREIFLPNGTYEMVVRFEQSPANYQDFIFTAKWNKLAKSPNNNKYAGGLRVKEIKSYSNATANPIIKKYTYTKNYESSTSSGGIFSEPKFTKEDTIEYHESAQVAGGMPNVSTLYRVQCASAIQQVSYSGSPVGYAKVFETTNSPNQTGYSEYSFSVVRDEGMALFPYPPAESMEHERGKLLQVIDYKKSGNNFIKVKRKSFSYTQEPYLSSSKYPKSSFAIKWENNKISVTNPFLSIAQNLTPYDVTSGWQDLSYETTEIFSDKGSVSSSKSYKYDNVIHLLKTGESISNSKGKSIITKVKYAHDVNDDRLIRENRISKPLEIITSTGGVQISSQKTIYDTFQNGSLYLPRVIETLKGTPSSTNKLENRIVYHNYDNKGNPTEVSKKDGTRIVYIWGYNKTRVIAKIENATYSEINDFLDKEDDKKISFLQELSNKDKDEASEKSLKIWLNKLREIVYDRKENTKVTTYTYNPLIGVTSITDPRGETITYHYDDFNRLKHVKDSQDNILKEHKYKYKNN